ncbi:amino acid kinase family protein [Methylocucumis oryzae]|uniref:Uridylate kinase n=1 Tax=Methylocucumis oryzae TaxID=1632867 RepID=A0A0F3INI3_9GAMM|nr:uridylate kinase [Methylocucumis oryzae]KJV07109.1 uridylate kinase [Methylocucumis oryzae]
MKVIKLGGSLVSTGRLLKCLNHIEHNYAEPVVIVPGGGQFADVVRQLQQDWGFDDVTAHAMAILAMQQIALMIQGLKPKFALAHSVNDIQLVLQPSKVVIWSPVLAELNAAKINASWAITSDSLAAWLAQQLHADELILVKSALINSNDSLEQLTERGIVDPCFSTFCQDAHFLIKLINAELFYG